MLVYRLNKKKYKDSLTGKGAAIRGGRWNSPGIEIIYTASNRALAMSEVAVHVTFEMMPDSYWVMEIEIPDDIPQLKVEELPEDWNGFPYTESTRKIGDQLINNNKHLSYLVPSAVVQKEWNVLINPFHKDFKNVKILSTESFQLDRRLF